MPSDSKQPEPTRGLQKPASRTAGAADDARAAKEARRAKALRNNLRRRKAPGEGEGE